MSEAGPQPITGRETPIDPSVPTGALSEFYRAFNSRDLELMGANWLQDERPSMDNPVGGIRRGWNDIRSVYERIFSSGSSVAVEFFDYEIFEFSDTFLAVGRERGTLTGPGGTLDLKIRTSRWFTKVDGRWRQLHHHGSMDDADLLARYQAAVA